jgi:hypothetical protein
LAIVEKGDLAVQSKVKAGSLSITLAIARTSVVPREAAVHVTGALMRKSIESTRLLRADADSIALSFATYHAPKS